MADIHKITGVFKTEPMLSGETGLVTTWEGEHGRCGMTIVSDDRHGFITYISKEEMTKLRSLFNMILD